MSAPRRVALVALLGAVAGVGLWWIVTRCVIGGDERLQAPDSSHSLTVAKTGSATPAAADAHAELTAQRETALTPPTPGPPVTDVDRDLSLHGRVVDPSGRPIPAAQVVAWLPLARAFSVLNLDDARDETQLAETRSDSSGRFAIQLERGQRVDLAASADGFADLRVPDRYAGECVEVVLSRGCILSGRITRASDGAAVAGAALRVFRYGGPSTISFRSTSNAAGEYRFTGLPSERMVLEVLPRDDQSPGWIHLEFRSDGTLVTDVKVEPGLRVRGRVTDAATGAPIAGAEVGEGWTFRRKVASDADGAYELPGFGSSGVPDVHVRAKGYGRQLRQHLPPPVDGVIAADFALIAAQRAVGRIVDAGDAPVADAYVAAVASSFTGEGQLAEWPSTRSGPDGRFAVADLHPQIHHVLFVQKPGAATVVYEFPASEAGAAELDLGDVRLPPPALLTGRVVDDHGDGVADAEVVLLGANADRYRMQGDHPPERDPLEHYVGSRRGRSDDLGRFSFADLPAGTFRVGAQARGRPPSKQVEVSLAASETKSGVEVVLPGSMKIAGRVVAPSGEAVAGVRVAARQLIPNGDEASVASDRDGSFELKGLTAGHYTLEAETYSDDPDDPKALLLHTVLADVEAGVADLRFEMLRGAPITGSLVDERGAPVAGAWVEARRAGQDEAAGAARQESFWSQTGRDGRFRIVVPTGISFDLTARSEVSGFQRDRAGVLARGVAAGARDVTLQVRPAEGVVPAKADGR
jgi:protocatechuate 3,4-dioxygenase beta subunit